MGRPRKPTIPDEILGGLYVPSFMPSEHDLNEFVRDPDQERKQAQRQVQGKLRRASSPEPTIGPAPVERQPGQSSVGIPVPLTEDEANEVDLYIEQLRGRIATQRDEISRVRGVIDEAANPKNDQELTFSMNIKKRPRLKRAIQVVFGAPFETITYSMYLAALNLRRKLEKQEAREYLEETE